MVVGIITGLGAGFVGCTAPVCRVNAIEVTYKYDTSCLDVAVSRRGTLTWNVPEKESNPPAIQSELVLQSQKAGLFMEEVLLDWNPSTCPTSASQTTPMQVRNIQRIVLAPDDGSGATVQRLLACEPIGSQPPNTLHTKFLFACRTGQNTGSVCTLEFELP